MHNALLLGSAIVAEIIATSALNASDGFSKLWPSVLIALAYGIAYYLLSQALKLVSIDLIVVGVVGLNAGDLLPLSRNTP